MSDRCRSIFVAGARICFSCSGVHKAEARGEGSAKESLPLFHKHDSQEVPEQKTKDHSHNCRDDSNLAVACARTVCEVHISALIAV